jgi:hypothetical protein
LCKNKIFLFLDCLTESTDKLLNFNATLDSCQISAEKNSQNFHCKPFGSKNMKWPFSKSINVELQNLSLEFFLVREQKTFGFKAIKQKHKTQTQKNKNRNLRLRSYFSYTFVFKTPLSRPKDYLQGSIQYSWLVFRSIRLVFILRPFSRQVYIEESKPV